MTDAAWMQIAPILQALAVVISAGALWRANGSKKLGDTLVKKTDDQTVMIVAATEAAQQAEKNTNGNLDKLRARLDQMTENYMQAAKEHSHQLATLAATAQIAPVQAAPGGRRADDTTKKDEPQP